MSRKRNYRIHGVDVRSEIPLDEPARSDVGCDVEVTVEPPVPSIPEAVPAGRLLAELRMSGRLWYAAARDGRGSTLRFPDFADFHVRSDGRQIVCVPAASTPLDAASLLLGGTVLAFWLDLQGFLVLHASAVSWQGRAVAFAGLAGMGKSTCAALACVAGAVLVADDVLAVDLGEAVQVFPGSSRVRLRSSASEIVALADPPVSTWTTFDDRVAFRPACVDGPEPLAAVVIPQPDRTCREVSVTRLDSLAAVSLLLGMLRIPRWHDRTVRVRQLRQVARLVDSVPVYRAAIPWGPPFDPTPVATVLDSVTDRHG